MARVKKKVRKLEKDSKNNPTSHRIHHHVRLGAFFATKIAVALIAFIIGLFIGNFFNNTLISVIVACAIAISIYFLGVLRLIKWMEI